jgi:Phosphotransferase enzyme family.
MKSRPFLTRIFWSLRRIFSKWLGYQVTTPYVPGTMKGATALGTGYILIEYIDSSQGEMLSNTWSDKRHDAKLRQNLFRDLSRTLLSLSRIPFPKIGSFTLDNKGYLTLSNRPLTLDIHYLENQNIPIDISRDSTHSSTDTYINDLFSIHEGRFRHQPNAVNNIQDAFYQACGLTVMRSVWPCFFRRDLLRGPFFFSLTDLHQSNIFVDKDWNITCIIDLEWACTRPVEMIHPPSWLSDQPMQLIDEEQYTPLHEEFLDIFEEEENGLPPEMKPPFPLYPIMKQGLQKGTLWCSYALNSPGAIFDMFYKHIQPRFAKSHIDEDSFWLITMPYWGFDTYQFLGDKLEDKARYDEDLRKVFERRKDEDDATEQEQLLRIRVFDKSTGYKNASMLKESHFHSLSLYQLHTCR